MYKVLLLPLPLFVLIIVVGSLSSNSIDYIWCKREAYRWYKRYIPRLLSVKVSRHNNVFLSLLGTANCDNPTIYIVVA